jgi:excisionase family DNA binding protein
MRTEIPIEPLLTVDDVRQILPVSRATVYGLVKSGRLDTVNIGIRKTRFRRSDVAALPNSSSMGKRPPGMEARHKPERVGVLRFVASLISSSHSPRARRRHPIDGVCCVSPPGSMRLGGCAKRCGFRL